MNQDLLPQSPQEELDEDFLRALGDPAPWQNQEHRHGHPVVKHPASIPTADLAEEYLLSRDIRPVFWHSDIYRYNGTYYERISETDLRADVNAFLQGTATGAWWERKQQPRSSKTLRRWLCPCNR